MYVYKLAYNILNVMLASESKQKLELSLKVINTPPPPPILNLHAKTLLLFNRAYNRNDLYWLTHYQTTKC